MLTSLDRSGRGSHGRTPLRLLWSGMVVTMALAVGGVSVGGCIAPRTQAGSAVATVGEAAPEFALEAVGGGETVRLADYRGKPLILNFFCGCGLCDELGRAWHRHRDKLGEARLLAVMHTRDSFNP